MKQATLIPWAAIDALVKGENPTFYKWLDTIDAPIVLMPKPPENMAPNIHEAITKNVKLAVHASEKKPSLKAEGFVHQPDFEINVDLEHVVELLADLEEQRTKFGLDGQERDVERILHWQRVVVEPYYDKLEAYLQPYANQQGVETHRNILRAENRRYMAAFVLGRYKRMLTRVMS